MLCCCCFAEGEDVGDGPDKILNHLGARDDKAKSTLKNVMSSVYYGWLGLTGGAPAHEAEKFAGKLVIAGFAIFCLLFSASYTGSTAAILIAETGKRSTITGLQDIAAMPGGKLCMMLASQHRFVLQYPQFDVSSQGSKPS